MSEAPSAPAVRERAHVRRPFFVKIALAIASTVSLALAAFGLFVLSANEVTLEDLARSRQHLALEDVSRALSDTLRESEDGLETVGRIITETPEAQADAIPSLIASFVSGASQLDAIGVYDPEGARLDVVRERDSTTALPTSISADERTLAAEQGSASWVDEDGSVLSIVPLLAEDRVTGFVAGRTSLDPVRVRLAELAERHFGQSEAPILLVDDRDRVLAGRTPLLDPAPEALSPGLSASRVGSYAEVIGEGDARRLVTIESIPLRPFRVAVMEPAAVVFASLAALRRVLVLAVAFGIALSLLVAYALGRGLASPIARLVEAADHLAHRRFDQRARVKTGDELEVLGVALDDASRDLEESEARIAHEIAIRTDLGRYLPAEIVDRVVLREQDMALGGSRRRITVLFADVVGFTPLTERLPPEETVRLLNELFSLLTEIVFRHGGTIDKFLGDSVMALFGAPTDQDDHAARALACAEDMLRFLDTGNAGWRERLGVTIELAIGVASGECVVGNVGSERRMEYTAIGDVVNTASRLEAIARPNQILLDAQTAELAGEGFELVDRGARELPGKRALVQLYEVQL